MGCVAVGIKKGSEQHRCPKCKSMKLHCKSEQNCEDSVDVWIECAKCQYKPTDLFDAVETVWGIEDWAIHAAFDIWKEKLEETQNENQKRTD